MQSRVDLTPFLYSKCNQSGNACTCEDWDKDGRFGVVLYKGVGSPKVLKANKGHYYDCTAYKSKLSKCQ